MICDETITPDVTALYFVLDYLGHDEFSVCAEGLMGWQRDGYEFTDEETLIAESKHRLDVAVHPKTFQADPDRQRVVDSLDASPQTGFRRLWVVASEVVPAEFDEREHSHIPWSAHFDESGMLLPAGDLWTLYEDAGASPFSDVAVFAGDWKEASVNYFVLRLLGMKRVAIYVP